MSSRFLQRPDPGSAVTIGDSLDSAPMFSVITTVYNPQPDHLAACLRSVRDQTGDVTWEHVVVDDHSSSPAVVEMLDGLASSHADPRVRVHRRPVNGGIVAASNDALGMARGRWVVLLDHDDVLAPHALASVAVRASAPTDGQHGQPVSVVYSDHDLIRPDGRYANPVYKPDFAPEWLRHTNYITHLVAIRRADAVAVGGFAPGTDGAQDHDLLLRLAEAGSRVEHIPAILLHWRQAPDSVASDMANKPTAVVHGAQAVQAHLDRCGVDATVSQGAWPGSYQIERNAPTPPVSVVIPTRGSRGRVWGVERIFVIDAIRSIAAHAANETEFVVVADADIDVDAVRALDRLDRDLAIDGIHAPCTITMVRYDEPFNFSHKVNLGVVAASHEHVLILNDDTELIAARSVARMAALLTPDDLIASTYGPVGLVGAKLLYPDGTLQHAGHLYHGEFMHVGIGWMADEPGPMRMFGVDREVAGVTAAAMMTTKTIFDRVGGFNTELPLHFNDVDFSVRVRAAGHRIIYASDAKWFHFEGRTRRRGATMDEWRLAAGHWPDGVPTDPYANPNLIAKASNFVEVGGRAGAAPYYINDAGEKRWG